MHFKEVQKNLISVPHFDRDQDEMGYQLYRNICGKAG